MRAPVSCSRPPFFRGRGGVVVGDRAFVEGLGFARRAVSRLGASARGWRTPRRFDGRLTGFDLEHVEFAGGQRGPATTRPPGNPAVRISCPTSDSFEPARDAGRRLRFEPAGQEPTSGARCDRERPARRRPRACSATRGATQEEPMAQWRTTAIGQMGERGRCRDVWRFFRLAIAITRPERREWPNRSSGAAHFSGCGMDGRQRERSRPRDPRFLRRAARANRSFARIRGSRDHSRRAVPTVSPSLWGTSGQVSSLRILSVTASAAVKTSRCCVAAAWPASKPATQTPAG